uniref:Unconventional myosin-IXb-like n=1 Tax=Sinocyclocheilus anshuiensis TaxID=1608454 RepID=A0A671Q2Y7_9TELE
MSVKDGDGTTSQDGKAYELQIYPRLSLETASCCTLRVTKEATAASVIRDAAATLGLDASKLYVLAEVKECGGEEWVLESTDLPVHRVLLWPRKAQEQHSQKEGFYFLLQERNHDGSIRYVHLPAVGNEQESKRLVARGFLPPQQEDFEDLCNLPVLSEDSILDNLRIRFQKNKIYTYAGSILIAINPFKFLPIYNPKYVKMYENHQLGKLEPHIFAIADVAYYAMLRKHVNQCIVISGESGSGKTQSTNFLIHCLTALSQKGYASGVERTILGAGPVLEAFGNAKTAHNDNSSRFGKFIQVNYLESGVVRGAVVEKYLLEKSRLKLQRFSVFVFCLQQNFTIEDADDLRHDFERLQQAMEMVGFLPTTKRQIFSVLSAILYLGNVTYSQKASGREEGLDVGPPEVLSTLSDLLKVKEELLVEALTKRKTVTVNDKLILPYSHSEAITARDSMAKSLYSALFDWIVLRINHALLNKRDMEESVSCLSIGVLDIFGFEDFETNSFEQFCINYANEQLQYYFNQHIFKLEQEEYQAEGITWHNIDYTDNVGCIHLISKKPTGLLYLLDEESNFPHATDKPLLAKFKQQHQQNHYFVATPVLEPAFVILHFAGKVKYQIKDFREKNTDHMRPDIVALLRSSDRAYVRQLIGMDPVAMFRWGILRATVRALAAFNEAGRRWAAKTAGVVRPNSRVPLGELQRSNMPIERMYREMHVQIINSIKDLQLDGEDPRKLLQSWGRLRFPRHVLQKNKNPKTKQLIPKNLLDSRSLKFVVGLHDRTTKSLLHLHKKKRPPSISAQFQTSLSKLLETLGKAEPFFIRCLRSNAEKKEMCFDEALVVQQLRYTGMLETVRIRRSGYGAKYTFQEFTEQFRVLLPKKAKSLEDISSLLHRLGFDHTTYQIGKTKVYLKELERQKLQDILHKDVVRKIIFLQRWFRAKMQRMEFIRMREAAILIQRSWRSYRKEKFYQAAVLIQSAWRGSKQRAEYRKTQASVTKIQALARGHSQSDDVETLVLERNKAAVDVEIEGKGRAQFDVSKDQNRSEKFPQVEAGPHPEVKEHQKQKENGSSAHPREEGTHAKPTSPEIPTGQSQNRAPSLSKLPAYRSQEKRELRRQRGLEHNQRESERAASAGKDDTSFKSKTPESPGKADGKLKERSDSKELDQYTFVAWKVDKTKRDAKDVSPDLVRPSTLPLDIPTSGPGRNGYTDPSIAAQPALAKEEANRKKEPSRSNTQPENLIAGPRSLEDRHIKSLQYGFLCSPCISFFISLYDSDNIFYLVFPTLPGIVGSLSVSYPAVMQLEFHEQVALWALKETCSSCYSFLLLHQQKPQIGYKALMNSYHKKVISLAGEKQKGEVPLVVNLFQSVLDGFIRAEIKKEEAEPAKVKVHNPLDHVFTHYQVNIMQSCDQCTSYIWGMEKAYMCSYCKMVCHKKCICKIVIGCSMFCSKKCDDEPGSQHFGVRVCHLVNNKTPVPIVLEIMLEHVEMNGLYTEGIYRKSGSANRMKELHQLLEAGPENVCLEDYPIHAVTGLVKQWLRELPEPLMTFTHYNDFLRAIELPEKQEQLQAIYKVLEQLPTANFNTLERLIFHLVRVAKEEKSNRMTPNSLAIVFAPCILRCPDSADPLMSMKDVAKTTTCVEMLLNEQIRRYNERMEEIEQLEYAEALAVNQLKLKRQNTCWHLPLRFITPYKEVREKPASDLCAVPENEPLDSDTEAERSLVERIKSIKQEKEDLACRLPELEQPGSDQENLDSEASVSSESLLDERAVCSDTEGHHPCVGPVLVVTWADGPSLPSLSSPRLQLQRRHPIIPKTVKLPPGVLCHPAVQSLPARKAQSLTLVQRREQPGRRKDSIQSLYITAGTELLFPPSPTTSDTSSAQELQTSSRRFSDPDIAFVKDEI